MGMEKKNKYEAICGLRGLNKEMRKRKLRERSIGKEAATKKVSLIS